VFLPDQSITETKILSCFVCLNIDLVLVFRRVVS